MSSKEDTLKDLKARITAIESDDGSDVQVEEGLNWLAEKVQELEDVIMGHQVRVTPFENYLKGRASNHIRAYLSKALTACPECGIVAKSPKETRREVKL